MHPWYCCCEDCNRAADTESRLMRQITELRKRLRKATTIIKPCVDYEIGEGTRGHVRDPLRDALDVLDLRIPLRRKARKDEDD